MTGYSDGTFRPDEKISRSELAALIAGAFKLTGTGNTSFTGYADNTFKPEQDITRAEFATIIARLIETGGEKEI